MNKSVSLTRSDAVKVSNALLKFSESQRIFSEGLQILSNIFGKFSENVEQLELPDPPPEYCDNCGVIKAPGEKCQECPGIPGQPYLA